MTREEARNFIAAIVRLRETATDSDALDAVAVYPAWREGVVYAAGQRVRYGDVLYRVLLDHTSESFWTPDTAHNMFARLLIPDENVIPAWEQPDSTNTYRKGDRVTHNGKTWEAELDNNSWEPGVYGWREI